MMSSNSFNPNNFAHDSPGLFGSQGGGGLGAGSPFGGGMGGSGGGGLMSFLQGIFGDSGAPYGDYMKQLKKYYGQSQGYQNPFYQAGLGGMGNFQDWLSKMKDPGAFINKTMEGYQQSPYNKFLQDQSMKAGTNAASAGGTIGSTPFAQQMQQNSSNIAQGGMNDWLQQVLGVNSEYGAGQGQLMKGGQNAADMMSQLAMMMGGKMGQGAFGQKFGQDQDFWNMMGGLKDMFSHGIFG